VDNFSKPVSNIGILLSQPVFNTYENLSSHLILYISIYIMRASSLICKMYENHTPNISKNN
jgi:hypothetical protein